MKLITQLVVTFVLVLGGAPATYADVDVSPVPNSPRVSLDGTVPVRDDQPLIPAPGSGPQPVEDTWAPVITCRVDPNSNRYGCRRVAPGEPADAAPQITEGDILRATREIGLPSLKVKIQPGETTLVNVPTIFHAEPRPFERSVTLLGFDVDLVATPITFHWVHGDGTSQDTSTPGKPYPALDVTHSYLRPADDVKARVDVTYRVRYRVNGQAWQTLSETITASGPVAELDVDEAAPVLTKP